MSETVSESASESPSATYNTLGSGGKVGLQGDHIENSYAIVDSWVYINHAGLSAEEKFARGVRCLDNGVPSKAREFLEDAIADGHASAEVYFHLVLALFSKRSHRELTSAEQGQLRHIKGLAAHWPADRWTDGLSAIFRLLEHSNTPRKNDTPELTSFFGLPSELQEKIRQHLELALSSGIADVLWTTTKASAAKAQLANQRTDRAWIFFQPEPAGPRARLPVKPVIDDRASTVVWTTISALVVAYLGWLLVSTPAVLPILAYIVGLSAGYVGVRAGIDWRYQKDRYFVLDQRRRQTGHVGLPSPNGFTAKIRDSFLHYSRRFAPRGVDLDHWLEETAGIREHLSAEVAEIYREQRVTAGQVNWLIRFLVEDTRKRYLDGTLYADRDKHLVAFRTKLMCTLFLGVAALAIIIVAAGAVINDPVPALLAIAIAVAAGRLAALGWWTAISANRTYSAEVEEHEKALAARTEAYRDWRQFLDANRPSEAEMESWLNSDRTMLLARALDVYKLRKSDVVAHSFLLTPAYPRQAMRMKAGPVRYSRYNVMLILVSRDGVRQFSTELLFTSAIFRGEDRKNYRFDAISSIDVTKKSDFSHSMALTLTNGPTTTMHISGPTTEVGDEQPLLEVLGDDGHRLAQIDLDSAGFAHMLHILEGIAAEGKRWLDRSLARI